MHVFNSASRASEEKEFALTIEFTSTPICSVALLDGFSCDFVLSPFFFQSALKFHGGGHVNHSIFWTNLAPKSAGGGAPPTGALAKQIEADFGSFEALKAQMSAQSVAIQGSGWGWSVGAVEQSSRRMRRPLGESISRNATKKSVCNSQVF